ncbi:GNAT family N-acetyltransferase [Methanooceanicella nereidis]|nr:GNAT family N-acetyltransferase [Methanocella sp. CWC-04]
MPYKNPSSTGSTPEIEDFRKIVNVLSVKNDIKAPKLIITKNVVPDIYVEGFNKDRMVMVATTGVFDKLKNDEILFEINNEISSIARSDCIDRKKRSIFDLLVQIRDNIVLSSLLFKKDSGEISFISNNDICIRKANYGDILDIYRMTKKYIYFQIFPLHYLLKLFNNRMSDFFIAEEKGEFIGFLIGLVKFGIHGPYGYINLLITDENHRRKGIARYLLISTMEGFKTYGCKECYLEVKSDNIGAISLYKKLGFETKEVLPKYYSDGGDANLMIKNL